MQTRKILKKKKELPNNQTKQDSFHEVQQKSTPSEKTFKTGTMRRPLFKTGHFNIRKSNLSKDGKEILEKSEDGKRRERFGRKPAARVEVSKEKTEQRSHFRQQIQSKLPDSFKSTKKVPNEEKRFKQRDSYKPHNGQSDEDKSITTEAAPTEATTEKTTTIVNLETTGSRY